MSRQLYFQYRYTQYVRHTSGAWPVTNQSMNVAGQTVSTHFAATELGGYGIFDLVGMGFDKARLVGFPNNVGDVYWSVRSITVPDDYAIPPQYLVDAVAPPTPTTPVTPTTPISPTTTDNSSAFTSLLKSPVFSAVANVVSAKLQAVLASGSIQNPWASSLLGEMNSKGMAAFSAYGVYDTLSNFVDSSLTNISKLESGTITLSQYQDNATLISKQLAVSLANSTLPLPLFSLLSKLDVAEVAGANKFSPDAYAVNNPDINSAMGANPVSTLQHYISAGASEGRVPVGFSASAYAAQNPDVYQALGLNRDQLISHYINYGRREGRIAEGFDAYAYAALNPDVYAAFGTNVDALVRHYATIGHSEGRSAIGFDINAYAALNPDLFTTFGTDAGSLIQHYIVSGRSEHRATTGFDPNTYAALNPDVYAAYGNNADQLISHYISSGANEHRKTDFNFVRSTNAGVNSGISGSYIAATNYIFSVPSPQGLSQEVNLQQGKRYQVDLMGASTGQGTLSRLRLDVYRENLVSGSYVRDENWHWLSADGGIGNNARLNITVPTTGRYEVRVSTPDIGTAMLTVKEL